MNSGIFFILISVTFNVLGQIAMKFGANQLKNPKVQFNSNIVNDLNIIIHASYTPYIITGFLLYFISAGFWIIALSKVNLSYAYPMLSLGYILIMIASYYIFKEQITLFSLLGVILIIGGIFFISLK